MKPRLAFLILLVIVAVVNRTYSLPESEVRRIFWSDETRTAIAGEKWILCDGTHYSWGDRTNWTMTEASPCAGGGSCAITCEECTSPWPGPTCHSVPCGSICYEFVGCTCS